jgi:glycosyltransferase involved in cell wall biosynthesis
MISVIIPTLNEEKLLPGMLGQFSADAISRFDLQLIVSDGGSTDKTLEIARRFAHLVVENADGSKQTISIGRNRGASRASGDILVFLNADTLIKDVFAFFSRLSDVLRDQTIGAVTCSVQVYPTEERWTDVAFHCFYNWFFFMMNQVGMAMGRGECHIMRKSAFECVGGYSAGIAAGEDYDMFRKLKAVGRVLFLKELLVYESPRRYRKYGYAYVTLSWFFNFLSVFFLGRSILSQWKPVR